MYNGNFGGKCCIQTTSCQFIHMKRKNQKEEIVPKKLKQKCNHCRKMKLIVFSLNSSYLEYIHFLETTSNQYKHYQLNVKSNQITCFRYKMKHDVTFSFVHKKRFNFMVMKYGALAVGKSVLF